MAQDRGERTEQHDEKFRRLKKSCKTKRGVGGFLVPDLSGVNFFYELLAGMPRLGHVRMFAASAASAVEAKATSMIAITAAAD